VLVLGRPAEDAMITDALEESDVSEATVRRFAETKTVFVVITVLDVTNTARNTPIAINSVFTIQI
jgi:hypothetical protein